MGNEKDDPTATIERKSTLTSDRDEGTSTGDGTGQRTTTRRSFVAAGAAALGLGSLGVLGDTARAAGATDAVEAGADPKGGKPVDGVLADLAGDGATISFPSGEYRLGSFESSYDGLTLQGTDATFVVDGGHPLTMNGDGWTVDGFDFDFDAATVPGVRLSGSDWTFENVVFRNTQSRGPGGQSGGAGIYPSVASGSTGTVRNLYMADGAASPDGESSLKAMWAADSVQGTLHIDGIWAEHWGENTLYMHNVPGKVVVENSYFRNTNVAGTRVGGNTVLRNNTYIKDGPHPAQRWSGGRRMRGVWVSGGNKGAAGNSGPVVIEDCDFVFTHADGAGPPIQIQFGSYDTITVRNSRFTTDFGTAINAESPCDLVLEDLSFGGSATPVSAGPASVSESGLSEGTEGADESPPIPKPPETGSTPSGGSGGNTVGGVTF